MHEFGMFGTVIILVIILAFELWDLTVTIKRNKTPNMKGFDILQRNNLLSSVEVILKKSKQFSEIDPYLWKICKAEPKDFAKYKVWGKLVYLAYRN